MLKVGVFLCGYPKKGCTAKVRNTVEGYFFVTLVKTGVQKLIDTKLDSRFRGNDKGKETTFIISLRVFQQTPARE